jgi:hypothetical protein
VAIPVVVAVVVVVSTLVVVIATVATVIARAMCGAVLCVMPGLAEAHAVPLSAMGAFILHAPMSRAVMTVRRGEGGGDVHHDRPE